LKVIHREGKRHQLRQITIFPSSLYSTSILKRLKCPGLKSPLDFHFIFQTGKQICKGRDLPKDSRDLETSLMTHWSWSMMERGYLLGDPGKVTKPLCAPYYTLQKAGSF
jgi:hypothetical protein